jgi:DNA-binding MarR family transcriptional regulator
MLVQESDPCYMLNKAAHLLECRINQRLAEIGLTFSQFRLIETLYENEQQSGDFPLSPAELADSGNCERPTITGIIDRLEKQGLVKRELNPRDRRSQTVLLTDKARGLIRVMDQTFAAMKVRALNGFDDQETAVLQDFLRRIIHNLDKKNSNLDTKNN